METEREFKQEVAEKQEGAEQILLIKCPESKSAKNRFEQKVRLYTSYSYEKEIQCSICKKPLRFKMNELKLDPETIGLLLIIITLPVMTFIFINQIFMQYGINDTVVALFIKFSLLFVSIAAVVGLLVGRMKYGVWQIQKGAILLDEKEEGVQKHLIVRRKSFKKVDFTEI